MHPLLLLMMGLAAYSLYRGSDAMKLSLEQSQMEALVRRTSRALGVPEEISLAFAWLESRLNPRAEGDLQWAFKRPDKYRALVLDAPRFRDNEFRTDAQRWHSYGLFQLLAPYHIQPYEDPRILLDPRINAERGIKTIANLLEKHDGDPIRARLAFAGALNLGPETQALLTKRVREAIDRWAQQGVA